MSKITFKKHILGFLLQTAAMFNQYTQINVWSQKIIAVHIDYLYAQTIQKEKDEMSWYARSFIVQKYINTTITEHW